MLDRIERNVAFWVCCARGVACVLYYQMGHELFGQCNCGGGLAAIGKHVNQAAAKTDNNPGFKPLLVPDSEMAALFPRDVELYDQPRRVFLQRAAWWTSGQQFVGVELVGVVVSSLGSRHTYRRRTAQRVHRVGCGPYCTRTSGCKFSDACGVSQ